jgi:outer membrane biosynthesis protein TonB
MIGSRLKMGSGSAVSIVAHLALLGVAVLFANAHPFDPTPSQAIAIDIVAPEEVKPPPEPPEPAKPVDQKQPDPVDLSALMAPLKPQTQSSAAQQAPQQKSQAAAAPASRPQSSPAQAAAKPQSPQPPQGAEASQPSPPAPPPAPPAPAPGVPTVEPDVTVKYGVALGLPTTGGDYNGIEAPAFESAKISATDVAALRRHLKSCSTLPPSIAPTDKVRIVLRVLLARDGRLMAEPALIEASASAKGPVLMQKAMDALQACQPYAMLPADKYNEWKVLDLPFTPQDFVGG